MNEVIVWKLVDMAFDALQVGLERQVIVGKLKELEEKGATPDELADAIKQMRDEALNRLGR